MAWCLVKHRDNFTFAFTFTPDTDGKQSATEVMIPFSWETEAHHVDGTASLIHSSSPTFVT
jgi:hypothetical protein